MTPPVATCRTSTGEVVGPVALTAPVCGALDSGTVLTWPAVLANDSIALTFDADPLFGVRLVSLEDRHGADAFTWQNLPPEDRGADHRLWELRGTLRSGFDAGFSAGFGGTFTATGATATGFRGARGLWHDGEPCFFFTWNGVTIPGADDCATVRVVVSVVLPPGSNVSKWHITVIPEEVTGEFSLDEVDFPRTWWKAPIAPIGGGTHLEAQGAARLIIPQNFLETTHAYSQNSSLAFWVNPDGEAQVELGHPQDEGKFQTMQWAAIAAGDPQDGASYRRILFLGSEDGSGHFKKFRYEGCRCNANTEARMGWRHTYLPPWWRSERDVEFHSAYPATIGALLGHTDALWFEAAREYRRFVRRGIGGLRKEARGGPSLLGGDPFFVLLSNALRDPAYHLYDKFVERVENIRNALRNPLFTPTAAYVQWQNWLLGGVGAATPPSTDFAAEMDAGLAEALEAAARLGQRVALYSQPRILAVSAGFAAAADALVVPRRVDPAAPAATELVFDFGTAAGARWWADNFTGPLAALAPIAGIYLDGVSGGYARLSYPLVVDLTTHLQHGGAYFTQGKREVFRLNREAIAAASPFVGVCNLLDADAFVASESVEEFIYHELSVAQEGYVFVPGLLQFAEPVVLGEVLGEVAALAIPSQVRHLSPPLWSAVYHEYANAVRLVMPWSNTALATAGLYPLEGFPGLTPEEFTDVFCFLFALTVSAGLKTAYTHLQDFDSPLCFADADGTLTVDPAKDPTGAGIVVGEFLRLLFSVQDRETAGRFLVWGSLELPPPVEDADPELTLVSNPLEACRRTHPSHAPATYPSYSTAWPTGVTGPLFSWQWQNNVFPVHQVLASAWRSPEGEPGLVLINWGRSEAAWAGTWEPREYGMSEVDSYGIAVETFAAPAPPLMGGPSGSGSGAADEDCSDFTGDTFFDGIGNAQLGPVPSREFDGISDARLQAVNQSFDGLSNALLQSHMTQAFDGLSDARLGAVDQTFDGVSDARLGVAATNTFDGYGTALLAPETPLSHIGTLRIHARGSLGGIVNRNVDIGALPPHSVTVITFPSTGPRTGSGFSNGFDSGFGGSQSVPVAPRAFSSGFDSGFE